MKTAGLVKPTQSTALKLHTQLCSGTHEMNDTDRRALENIAKYGCNVLHIMEEDDLPPFTYSMGISQQTSKPEIVVVGLKKELSHFMNEYNRRVVAGESFEPHQRYPGFIEGFDCEIRTVHQSHFEEYFGRCLWLYEGPYFEVIQLVWPNTSGVWPWQAEASSWLKAWQPVLDAPRTAVEAPSQDI